MSDWVVVVDDEALSLTNARNLLNAENMRVSCLRSGGELLRFMEKNSPDLVLLDIMMPQMDGFETYHALRALEEREGRTPTPVIFLTGENDADVERRGLKAGASDFIRKPINREILLSRIKNTISNSRTIETLTEEATLDRLTGFLNKASGTERISALCAQEPGCLAIMDLDSFKLVNDLYGHDMGDRVLRTFSDLVRHQTRSGDLVCRIGGDEFLAWFSRVTEEEDVAVLTRRLNDQLVSECITLMGEEFDIPIGISVGAVMVQEHPASFQALFRLADSSLYHVKQNGKHGYEIYTTKLDAADSAVDESEDLGREIARMTQIVEERGAGNGALLLGQDSFSWNYRFIMRFMKRYNGSVTKILFSLTRADSSPEAEYSRKAADELTTATAAFVSVLQRTLRPSDIILQSKPHQFFLLLPELSEEDAAGVIERILKNWDEVSPHRNLLACYATQNISFRDNKRV